jgi:hypothetical protein
VAFKLLPRLDHPDMVLLFQKPVIRKLGLPDGAGVRLVGVVEAAAVESLGGPGGFRADQNCREANAYVTPPHLRQADGGFPASPVIAELGIKPIELLQRQRQVAVPEQGIPRQSR